MISKLIKRLVLGCLQHPVRSLFMAVVIYFFLAIALAASSPYLSEEHSDGPLNPSETYYGIMLTIVVALLSLGLAPFFVRVVDKK